MTPAEDRVRIFCAVFPPPEASAPVAHAIETLRRPGDGVAWVRPATLHFTLRFLGEIAAERVDAVSRAASMAARDVVPFRARMGPTGMFPNEKRPRILWLGLDEGGQRMRALAARLDEALGHAGFGPADQPFSPHLTLGRVRDDVQAHDAIAAFTQAAFPKESFDVEELVVVRSTLDPRGARYEPVARIRLEPLGPAQAAGPSSSR